MKSKNHVLQRMREGNLRFAAGQCAHPNQSSWRRQTVAAGQKPLAGLLGCADSRVPPEIIFDCGLGDLFVVRTAGQIVDEVVLGSLEFGVLQLGIPLILVLGHQNCGAVMATVDAMQRQIAAPGHIGVLVDAIRPAFEITKDQPGNLLDNAIQANISLSVKRLRASPVLAAASNSGRLVITGGYYDLDSGRVDIQE